MGESCPAPCTRTMIEWRPRLSIGSTWHSLFAGSASAASSGFRAPRPQTGPRCQDALGFAPSSSRRLPRTRRAQPLHLSHPLLWRVDALDLRCIELSALCCWRRRRHGVRRREFYMFGHAGRPLARAETLKLDSLTQLFPWWPKRPRVSRATSTTISAVSNTPHDERLKYRLPSATAAPRHRRQLQPSSASSKPSILSSACVRSSQSRMEREG